MSALRLYSDLAALRMRLALAKLALKVGFDPGQPRVPAGQPRGGQWSGGGESRLAANEPKKPPVVVGIPMYGVDPLDPKNLNTPPTPAELADAQRALDAISKMDADSLARIGKDYNNYPARQTGAVLPPSPTGYMSFPVGGARSRSAARLVIDTSTGAVYYTNNHYLSFYHWNLIGK